MKNLSLSKMIWVVSAFCAATAIASPAQTLRTLYSFPGISTAGPQGSLIQATNGNFYGTWPDPGIAGAGSVFEITPQGRLKTLHSFCPQGGNCADGGFPNALVQGSNGDFYGTTNFGGAHDHGTVFKISAKGDLTTLYSFCALGGACTDGEYPSAGLVQGNNGNFYGTTTQGGANGLQGTVFEITPGGKLTTLYRFCRQTNCPDGTSPNGLVQASNGNFYGTTLYGGPSGLEGTVFEITPAGKLTTLYTFCTQANCADGEYPNTLVQAHNGNFYGTTSGNVSAGPPGTIFEITPSGKFTALYTFCSQTNCADGANPFAGLIQATNGHLYGTASEGGAYGYGTAFEITQAGELTTLYSFCAQANCIDGMNPFAGLVQAVNGKLYGTTSGYGNPNCFSDCPSVATIFSLSVGPDPSVETDPESGKTEARIVDPWK
jgi:uncharacterized repeat protein (TIGR03803 family)